MRQCSRARGPGTTDRRYGASPDEQTREGALDQSQASSDDDGGAEPRSDTLGDIVHCVVRGPDQRIYVSDRRNNRVQVFEDDGEGGVAFVADIVIAPETGRTRTASDVAFSPDARFLYIADMMNGQVWILDATTYALPVGRRVAPKRTSRTMFWREGAAL